MIFPTGTVLLWTSGAIPDGWADMTDAHGFIPKGYKSGDSIGATVGIAFDGDHDHEAGEVQSGGEHPHGTSPTVTYSAISATRLKAIGTPSVTMARGHNHTGTFTLDENDPHDHDLTDPNTGVSSALSPHKYAIYIVKL